MIPREPWRTRLLILSGAINLFLVAMIGAHLALRPAGGPPRAEAVIDRMAHDLAAEDSGRFRAAMARSLPAMEAARTRMEAARAAMSRAFGSTPYDEAAVRQAMAAWQAAWMAWSNQLGAGMLEAVATLSPDGRRRLADAGLRHQRP